jgi:hypothetical protein
MAPHIMWNYIMAKKSGAQKKHFCEYRRKKFCLRNLQLKIQTTSPSQKAPPPQKELPPQKVPPPQKELPPQREILRVPPLKMID